MQQITIGIHEKRALWLWLISSIALWVIIIAMLGCYYSRKKHSYQDRTSIVNQIPLLSPDYSRINHQQSFKNFLAIIDTISTSIPNNVRINRCHYRKKKSTMLECESLYQETILDFIDELKERYPLEVQSMKHDTNSWIAIVAISM